MRKKKEMIKKLKKFLTLVFSLQLQGCTVSEVHARLVEEEITIPADVSTADIEEFADYLDSVIHDANYVSCLAARVEVFLAGRVEAIENDYHTHRTVPATALATASDLDADLSSGSYLNGGCIFRTN